MKVVATPGNIYHVEGWTNATPVDTLITHATVSVSTEDMSASANFATYYSDKPLTLSSVETNAAVYTVASVAESIVVLSEALGEIPSMTPLLVHNR